MTPILLVDNFDSFTFNLLHLFGQLPHVQVTVRRNNEDFVSDLQARQYAAMVISPGPGSPADEAYFGNCNNAIKQFGPQGLPILGVCLGFQGIALALGAALKRAPYPMHGKTTGLHILARGKLLRDVPENTPVMRYHSIMIDPDAPFPDSLTITAETTAGSESIARNGREIMAFEHRDLPIFGVQFHPESFGTECGLEVAQRFADIAAQTAYHREY